MRGGDIYTCNMLTCAAGLRCHLVLQLLEQFYHRCVITRWPIKLIHYAYI